MRYFGALSLLLIVITHTRINQNNTEMLGEDCITTDHNITTDHCVTVSKNDAERYLFSIHNNTEIKRNRFLHKFMRTWS